MTAQDHLDWLADRLAEFETKLSEAESTVARLGPVVTSLRGAIDALATDERGPTPDPPLFEVVSNGHEVPKPSNLWGKPFTPGNKNPSMPERRNEFAHGTLLEAAGKIIDSSPTFIHANQVTDAIFMIGDRKGFRLAKHSVASEMHRGAKKGLWRKVGPNLYQRL